MGVDVKGFVPAYPDSEKLIICVEMAGFGFGSRVIGKKRLALEFFWME